MDCGHGLWPEAVGEKKTIEILTLHLLPLLPSGLAYSSGIPMHEKRKGIGTSH